MYIVVVGQKRWKDYSDYGEIWNCTLQEIGPVSWDKYYNHAILTFICHLSFSLFLFLFLFLFFFLFLFLSPSNLT